MERLTSDHIPAAGLLQQYADRTILFVTTPPTLLFTQPNIRRPIRISLTSEHYTIMRCGAKAYCAKLVYLLFSNIFSFVVTTPET
jgi:hypothetical protein